MSDDQLEDIFTEGILSNNDVFIRILFEQYFQSLVVFATRYITDIDTCQDVVQDVFVYLVESKQKFNSKDHLLAYVYQMVKNRCLKQLRHEDVKEQYSTFYKENQAFEDSLYNNIIEEEVFKKLVVEINLLPNYYKSVYLLVLEGKKNQEIAEELGLSIETVKSYKKEGKKILQNRLKGMSGLELVFLYWHI